MTRATRLAGLQGPARGAFPVAQQPPWALIPDTSTSANRRPSLTADGWVLPDGGCTNCEYTDCMVCGAQVG